MMYSIHKTLHWTHAHQRPGHGQHAAWELRPFATEV